MNVEPWATVNNMCLPSRDQDSGTCDAPAPLGEPFRRAGTIGALREEAEVAVAIRLKCDPLAVAGPDGNRFFPLNVIRRGALRQTTHKSRRWPLCRHRCRRRGACRLARRANAMGPSGSFKGSVAPARSASTNARKAFDVAVGPTMYQGSRVGDAEQRGAPGDGDSRLTPSTIGTGPPVTSSRRRSDGTANNVPPRA